MKVIDVKAGIEEGKDTFKMPLKTPDKHTTLVITLNIRVNRCMTGKMVSFYERNKAVAYKRELVKLFSKYKAIPYISQLQSDYKKVAHIVVYGHNNMA